MCKMWWFQFPAGSYCSTRCFWANLECLMEMWLTYTFRTPGGPPQIWGYTAWWPHAWQRGPTQLQNVALCCSTRNFWVDFQERVRWDNCYIIGRKALWIIFKYTPECDPCLHKKEAAEKTIQMYTVSVHSAASLATKLSYCRLAAVHWWKENFSCCRFLLIIIALF